MRVNKMEEIGKAALKLFSEKGYLKTSMNDVATAVGMTKGGLYHHVEKKEQLLYLIHKEMVDAFLDRLASCKSTKDPVKILTNCIEAHLKLIADYSPNMKIFFTELKHIEDAPGFNLIEEKRDKAFAILEDIIAEGIEMKKFRKDLDPFLVAMLMNGMANWFYHWYRKDGRLSIKKIVEMVQTFVLKGVLE
jgi:TetR/AcrR family transcriptional regulator, cholesterol catabolism regulator